MSDTLDEDGTCKCCGLIPLPGTTNDGHKMSCNYSPRHQSKIAGPIDMLRKYAPDGE